MSGGASVTMIETSTGMSAQTRLENGARPFDVSKARGGIGGLRQREIVLRERNQQVGVIVQPCALNGLPCAKPPRRVLAQRGKPVLVEDGFFVGHAKSSTTKTRRCESEKSLRSVLAPG